MTDKIIYTPEQIEAMKDMRRNGKSYGAIAKVFGCSTTTLRVNLGRAVRPKSARIRRTLPRGMRTNQLNLGPPNKVSIPSSTLVDRDLRVELASLRTDLTAEFFGDPLPGYSALDRR